jgi:C4-dicarboxylate-specific signal transduction histidine kinase
VADRTEALRKATRELLASERMTALARLSAGVAHEINNPAAALAANLRYLLRALRPGEPVGEDARATLEDVRTLTERIVGFVRRLVDASRLSGAEPRHGSAASLAQAVDQAVDVARLGGAGAPARVRLDVPDDLSVAMDPATLTQLLDLLLRRAARHGSLVIVDARREDAAVRLRVVAPTAAEVAEDDDSARELATAAGLAAIYGGAVVGEEDALGRGAVVTLPLARGGAAAPSPVAG